ncbi:MAG: response regulator, partial [Chloroflexi bacterium]|nr:response regulator [Chloroflexota bacterium]MCI0643294.1 response regulator [Chloroflexota bacterium]
MTARRVLIIDDDPGILMLTEIVFRRAGYEAHIAANGTEGLARVAEVQPDIIILDVMMPDLDGYQVCQRIRANPQTAGVPILMLSAIAKDEDRERCFAVGANAFVGKPVSPKDLVARITALLD